MEKLAGEGRIKRSEINKFHDDDSPSKTAFRGMGKKSKGLLFEKKENSYSIEKSGVSCASEKKSTFKSSIF